MGIISAIMKPVVFAAKNLFRNSENITAARKALYGASKKGGPKKFESIFTNFVPKAKTGLKELSKEYKATKTTGLLKGIGSSFKNIWKTITSSTKAGVRAASIKSAGKSVSKLATFAGGAKGLFKGLGKCLKKLPVIGTILTVGFEIPEIYGAYKDGGFWEGTKQVLKSGSKLLVGAGCAALGTAIGGPVGGAIGWIAGDMLMDWIFPPYSEKKAKEETLTQNQGQKSQQTPNTGEITPEEMQKYQKLLAEQQKAQEQQTPTENVQPTVEQPVTQQPVTPTITDPTAEQPVTQQPVTSTNTAPTVSTPTTGLTDLTTAYSGINPSFGITGGFGANYPLYGGTTPLLYGSFGNLTNPIAANPYTNTNPFNFDSNLYSQYPSNYKFVYCA